MTQPTSPDGINSIPASATRRQQIVDSKNKTELPINGSRIIYDRTGPMQQVVEEATLVAPTELSVLLRGKTGTGKEQVAHYIHNTHEEHRREKDPGHKDGPFIAVNCASIPKELIGSELFGHEKGSFTGADKSRKGKFDAAEGGTIFLDEIDKMPKDQQANLLRVLEYKSFYRVGGDAAISTNVRVIAAVNQLTRRDKDGKKESTLIPDLYHRLTEYRIELPNLRNRPSDIPLLADHFIEKASMELEFEKPPQLTQESLDALMAHPWRGNVRELGNVIKGATLRAGDEGVITPKELKLPTSIKTAFASGQTAVDVGKILTHDGSVPITRIAEETQTSRQTITGFLKGDREPGTFEKLAFSMYKRGGMKEATTFFNAVMQRLIAQDKSDFSSKL